MNSRFFDKVLATVSLGGLILFMWVVASFVNEINLWIVAVVVLAIGINDFVTTFRRGQVPAGEIDQPSDEQANIRRHPT